MIRQDFSLAARYARGLFELACKERVEDIVLSGLENVNTVFKENQDLLTLLTNPRITNYEKHSIIEQLFKDNVTSLVTRFLKLLVDKNRFEYFESAQDYYRKIYLQHKNIKEVDVIVSVDLDAGIYNKLKKSLEGFFNSQIILKVSVDPAILGGVVVTADGRRLDMSIKNRLDQLRQRFQEARIATDDHRY